MTTPSRVQYLYYTRQFIEHLLVYAIIAISRLDKSDEAIDRSAARMKIYAKGRKPAPYEDDDDLDFAAE